MARSSAVKLFLLFLPALFYSITAFGQDQVAADSLKVVLAAKRALPAAERMMLLSRIASNSSSPDEVLLYADSLFVMARDNNVPSYTIDAYHYKGVAYRLKGNLKLALKNLFSSTALAAANKKYEQQAEGYEEIANTYSVNNDLKNVVLYKKKATAIFRLHGNREQLAINLLNTGYNYYELNEPDSALAYYNEAEPIFTAINLPIGKAYTIGNRALVYWKKGNYAVAERDLITAIKMLDVLKDEFGIADYHNQLGRLYFEQGLTQKAIDQTRKALQTSQKLGLKEQVRDASLLLSQLYKTTKDYPQAFDYLAQYIAYKDSIENKENTKQIANLRTEFEVSLKQKEIELLENNQELNRIYIVVTIVLLGFTVLLLLYFRQRYLNTSLMAANRQKQHDEKISSLLNMQENKALQAMVQGQENERKRLAHDLHNHFGSLLATVKVNLNAIDEGTISNYSTLVSLVDQACADIRNMSHSLNMGISDDFGLVPALKELTEHLKQANRLDVEFSASMGRETIGSANEIVIYRIVQELVSNVLKHAEATKLSILLTCFEEERSINIMVQDNGKGFDAGKEQKDKKGMGLESLKKMIADLHGDIRFDSNPASGTTVNIDLQLIENKDIITSL